MDSERSSMHEPSRYAQCSTESRDSTHNRPVTFPEVYLPEQLHSQSQTSDFRRWVGTVEPKSREHAGSILRPLAHPIALRVCGATIPRRIAWRIGSRSVLEGLVEPAVHDAIM